jgi:hypothetical protein
MGVYVGDLSWEGGGSYKGLSLEQSEYYDGGGIALRLVSGPDEVVAIVTTNLAGYGFAPDTQDSFFIKGYSESKGLADALLKAGVVEPVNGRVVAFGPWDATAGQFRLTEKYRL